MKRYSKEETRNIIDFCNDHDVRYNELGKNTLIERSTLRKVLNGQTKNPSPSTIAQIVDYLINKYPEYFDEDGNLLTEPKEVSLKDDPEYLKAAKLLDQLTGINEASETCISELSELILSLIGRLNKFEEENKKLQDACSVFLNSLKKIKN